MKFFSKPTGIVNKGGQSPGRFPVVGAKGPNSTGGSGRTSARVTPEGKLIGRGRLTKGVLQHVKRSTLPKLPNASTNGGATAGSRSVGGGTNGTIMGSTDSYGATVTVGGRPLPQRQSVVTAGRRTVQQPVLPQQTGLLFGRDRQAAELGRSLLPGTHHII